jgi:hypothetical protein
MPEYLILNEKKNRFKKSAFIFNFSLSLNKLNMIRLILAILIFFPSVLFAQQNKKETKGLKKEQKKVIQQKDTVPTELTQRQKKITSDEKRLQQMIEKYGKNKGRLIAAGKVWTSISREMALDSWGEPLTKQETELNNMVSERWNYPDSRFLYFENNRLVSWKE